MSVEQNSSFKNLFIGAFDFYFKDKTQKPTHMFDFIKHGKLCVVCNEQKIE